MAVNAGCPTGCCQIIVVLSLYFLILINAQNTTTQTQPRNATSTPAPGSTDIAVDDVLTEEGGGDGNCTIQYPEDAIEEFKELLDKPEEAIFVYFKLNFTTGFDSDMAYLSDNTTDVIDPLTWVWSKGGRGELLLGSPFDFVHLSLGTLSPGVYSMGLELTADKSCFSNNTSDVDKMRAIAESLLDLTKQADASLDNELIACRDIEEQDDEEEIASVCIEKQLGPDQFNVIGVYAFPSVSYTILQGSTVYECWTLAGLRRPKSIPVTTQSWLHWLLGGGIVLALFSPLALDFFIRKHPPIVDRIGTNERLMLVTDPIPVGFKYVFFFWRESVPGFHFFRWVIIISLFGFLQYIPLLVAFCVDSDGLAKRMAAVHRVGLINLTKDFVIHVAINLLYFVFALVLLGLYVSTDGHKFLVRFLLRERDPPTVNEDEMEGDEEEEDAPAERETGGDTNGNVDVENGGPHAPKSSKLQIFKHIGIFTPDEKYKLWTPDTLLPNARAFLFIMAYRMKMMFDPNLWRYCVMGLWETITSICGAPDPDSEDIEGNSRCNLHRIIHGLLFALIFPFHLILFVFLLCFNSVPLLYCLLRILQTVSKEVRISELAFFFGLIWVAVAWLCKFIGIFTYLAEMIGYTFVGLVANAEIVGPFCIVVLVFVGYFVNMATDFYDIYCKLFREVVEAAEEVDGEFEKLLRDHKDFKGGMTAKKLEGVLYRKTMKPARSISWVKDSKGAVAEERIEMISAPVESACLPPSPIDTNSLAESADQANTKLLSEEEQETLRLISREGFGSIVSYTKKGTPAIESKLFWLIVEKYCPVRGQAGAALVQLLLLAVVIALGMTILTIVDGFRDLPATVELFGSVIVAGVVPIFLVAMRSPESQGCYDDAAKRQLTVDVRYYALYGELKSMAV